MSELPPVRFGLFELDTRTGELRKHGVRLKIQEQPCQVLKALLERPGELVTREELRARIWAQDTFVDFDQGLNRAISKVRDVLSDPAGAPRFIETLPRRGYRFIAPVGAAPAPRAVEIVLLTETIAPPAIPSRSYNALVWATAGLLAIAAAGLWWGRNPVPPTPQRVTFLTSLTGSERYPAFSPDGKQVAFTWDGEKEDNEDIYVKIVGNERLSRLTTDPATDVLAAWSPDGGQIAFSRLDGHSGIYLVSPFGGPERKLADLVTLSRMSWTADGKFLLVAQRHAAGKPESGDGALFLVPVGGGEPRQVLAAAPGTWYRDPTYAPDGRSLAFVAHSGALQDGRCTLFVVGLDGLVPSGHPRPIQPCVNSFGLAWTADGASIIYGSDRHLWRANIASGTQERLELAGSPASYPALDSKAGRLAFSHSIGNTDIWRVQPDGKASPFLTSSLRDIGPQYSPDGWRIAFESARAGDGSEIWTAHADGTDAIQTTRIAHLKCGRPRWSPDGKWIAFDASWKDAARNIWVVDAGGGAARQLTHAAGENIIPSWSHDGSSIYFTSNRSGRFEIWRVPVYEGVEAQVTHDGGYVALESPDGKTLYYTVSESWAAGLYAKGLPDGDEKPAMKNPVGVRDFAVFADALYFLVSAAPNAYELRSYNFVSKRVQVVTKLEGALDIAVSPDRKHFLFTKVVGLSSDLMMIEHFR